MRPALRTPTLTFTFTLAPRPHRSLFAPAFGAALIALFAAQGCHVTALCRSPSSEGALLAAGASSVLVGDATDASFLQRALATAQPALVLCAVGTSPPAAACGGADASGTAALVAACVAAQSASPVGRFVLVSALGVAESLDCLPYASHDVLQPWLAAKEAAEATLRASGLEWTILRPGPLTDAPASGRAVATLDAASGKAFSTLGRADLAQVAYQARVGQFCARARECKCARALPSSCFRLRCACADAAPLLRLRRRRACPSRRAGGRCACWTERRSSSRRRFCASWRPGKAPLLTPLSSEPRG
jgi:uncharacterized protein YbjT (DUF2867 family)